jgi:hypothetical protein
MIKAAICALMMPVAIAGAAAQPKQTEAVFLCISPSIALSFWGDLKQIYDKNVVITDKIMHSVAEKNKCELTPSQNLKPTRFVLGILLMEDGKNSGWMTPDYYIIHINRR